MIYTFDEYLKVYMYPNFQNHIKCKWMSCCVCCIHMYWYFSLCEKFKTYSERIKRYPHIYITDDGKKTIHISATHFLPVLWFVFYSMWIHTHKQSSVAFFRKRAYYLYLLPPTPLFAISSYGNAKRTSLYIFDVIYKDHTPVIDYVVIILLDRTNSWKCTAVFCLSLYLDKIWKFTEPI